MGMFSGNRSYQAADGDSSSQQNSSGIFRRRTTKKIKKIKSSRGKSRGAHLIVDIPETASTDLNVTDSDERSRKRSKDRSSKHGMSNGHGSVLIGTEDDEAAAIGHCPLSQPRRKLHAFDSEKISYRVNAVTAPKISLEIPELPELPEIPKRVSIAERNKAAMIDTASVVRSFSSEDEDQENGQKEPLTPRSALRHKQKKGKSRMNRPPNVRPRVTRRRSRSHSKRQSLHEEDEEENHPGIPAFEDIKMAPMLEQYINPFEHRGEVYLCRDMTIVADAMKLDMNTQSMLALYDAKSLEDLSLLAQSDIFDLVSKARQMRRSIPPLQVRKIEVLREWAQAISKSKEEEDEESQGIFQAWLRRSTRSITGNRRSNPKKLIPDDWKQQFVRDLPKLKRRLRARSSTLALFSSVDNIMPHFQTITMCGMVD